MSVSISCPQCGKSLKFPDQAAGKKGRCPACGEVVRLPGGGSGGPFADFPFAGIDAVDFDAVEKRPAMPPPVPRSPPPRNEPPAPADVNVASPVATGFKMGIGMVLGVVCLVVIGCLVYFFGGEVLLIARVGPREAQAIHYYEQAQECMRGGDERGCKVWLRMILNKYPETESAKAVRNLFRELYPSLEAAGSRDLMVVQELLKAGKVTEARERLAQMEKDYPDWITAAPEAKKLSEQIGK